MKNIEELKEKLCKELEEFAQKPKMGPGDLEIVHKLTDTIKNIDKIEMLEDGDYSEDGYGRGSSYANRGRHYVRGHYSRADGYHDGMMGVSYARDSRGRYSRADGKEYMMDRMEELMDEAGSDREREIIQRCMAQLEKA